MWTEKNEEQEKKNKIVMYRTDVEMSNNFQIWANRENKLLNNTKQSTEENRGRTKKKTIIFAEKKNYLQLTVAYIGYFHFILVICKACQQIAKTQ